MKNENYLVVTFDNQSDAIDASHKLQDLTLRGDISIGYNLILKKGEKGQIEVLKKITEDGKDSWSGMFVGMLAGMFLGPFGFLLSTLGGTAIGAGIDHSHTKSSDAFAEIIKGKLREGKVAIVANVAEQSPAFVDEAMKEFNGEVYRTVFSK